MNYSLVLEFLLLVIMFLRSKTYIKGNSRSMKGLALRFVIGYEPKELGVVLVPLDGVKIPALQVVLAAQRHGLEDVGRRRHIKTQQLQTSSSCNQQEQDLVTGLKDVGHGRDNQTSVSRLDLL